MDTSTYEILKECNSGCRMAVNSIEQLVAYLKNQELQELFSKYKEDYEKMERSDKIIRRKTSGRKVFRKGSRDICMDQCRSKDDVQ